MTPSPFNCAHRGLAAALLACALAAPAAAAPGDDDPQGALIGELAFHADLMHALDNLCPRVGARTDWHAALATPVRRALTPSMRELSRRLGAEAGRQLLSDAGGCASGAFAAAYREEREEFFDLLDRWARFAS
jgi:hypothetical protein